MDGKAKLVVLGDKPLVAETPEHLLDDDTTPTAKFFIRNNGQLPDDSRRSRRLEDHHRRRGQQAARDHARRSEERASGNVTCRMVLECGGNGRSFFTPQARGNQWTNGGAGCAEWTGVRARRRAEGRRA